MCAVHGPRPPTGQRCEWTAAWSGPSCELPEIPHGGSKETNDHSEGASVLFLLRNHGKGLELCVCSTSNPRRVEPSRRPSPSPTPSSKPTGKLVLRSRLTP